MRIIDTGLLMTKKFKPGTSQMTAKLIADRIEKMRRKRTLQPKNKFVAAMPALINSARTMTSNTT